MNRASFDFYPKAFLASAKVISMSVSELGRYFTRHMQAIEERDREWVQAHPEPWVGRIYWRQKQARRGYVPPERKRQVLERDGFACRRCHATERLEIDHVHPYSKGGTHDVENLQVLCKRCNRKKRDRIEVQ